MAAVGVFVEANADGHPSVFGLDKTTTYTQQGNVETETKGNGFTKKKVYDTDFLYVLEEIINGKSAKRTNHEVSGSLHSLPQPAAPY